MAKLTLANIAAGFALITTINNNNDLIEALFEKTLSLDGTTPNAMTANLDMNSQTIDNLSAGVIGTQAVNLNQVNSAIAAAGASLPTGPIAAALVTVADVGGNFVSADVEGVLAEYLTGSLTYSGANIFSGIPTFTAQPVFKAAGGILIQDVGGTDSISISHDGTSVTVAQTNTLDFSFLALDGAGAYKFVENLQVRSGNAFNVMDLDNAEFVAISNVDGEVFITSAGAVPDGITLDPGSATDDVLITQGNLKLGTGYLFLKENATVIPTLALHGGIYVQNATKVLNYRNSDGDVFAIGGVGADQPTSTTAALEDVTNIINTQARKVTGFTVYNASTKKLVSATSQLDNSVWVDATGATVHTPV